MFLHASPLQDTKTKPSRKIWLQFIFINETVLEFKLKEVNNLAMVPLKPMESHRVHTVVMYPRPHPDNIVALWLLREFGEEYFPGVNEAKIDFWNQVPAGKTPEQWESEGYLLIDLGGGRFDHHHEEHTDDKTTCATTLVARYLGVDQRPELKKLLEFVRRDDLEGRGTMSKDTIDRAFGLSAVVMNLNRDYPDHPEYVIEVVTRIVLAHYHEEYRRKVLMPQEWSELLQQGRASLFEVQTAAGKVRVVQMETDSKAMVGFVRAIRTIEADVVVQRLSSGHTNIVTRQTSPRLDMRPIAAAVRKAEAEKKQYETDGISKEQWEKPRRLEGIDEWYFDTAANTLQNGGAARTGIPPTQLTLEEIKGILIRELPQSVPLPRRSPQHLADEPRTIRLADLPPRTKRGR